MRIYFEGKIKPVNLKIDGVINVSEDDLIVTDGNVVLALQEFFDQLPLSLAVEYAEEAP